MEIPGFFTAFQQAQGLKNNHEIIKLDYQNALDLLVTSGNIIGCDPYYCQSEKPYKQSIPSGHYPVILCIAHFQNSDQRVALAALYISNKHPTHWKKATCIGQDDTANCGYCVDSGTGCFMDADAVQCTVERIEDDPTFFEDQMSYIPTWGWANVSPNHSPDAANVVAFSSGWGDGNCPTFYGYDNTDQPVCLITDFGVLKEV